MNPEFGSEEHLAEVRKYSRRCGWVLAIAVLLSLTDIAWIKWGYIPSEKEGMLLVVYLIGFVCLALVALLGVIGENLSLRAGLKLKKISEERANNTTRE